MVSSGQEYHRKSQLALGQDFEAGSKTYRRGDYAAALNNWQTLARQGHAGAQYKLDIMHDNGWGVAKSDGEAVNWYRKAAMQGHAYAQYDLGLMFASGTGVPRDSVRAYMWLNLAIAQGNSHISGIATRSPGA